MQYSTTNFEDPSGILPVSARMLHHRGMGELMTIKMDMDAILTAPEWQPIIHCTPTTSRGYAKAALNITGLKKLYLLARGEEKSAFQRAVTDAITPPEILSIERHYTPGAGERFVIDAIDDFMVANVHVRIFGESGVLLEEGPADMQLDSQEWEYQTAIPSWTGGVVAIFVMDLPGNATIRIFNCEPLSLCTS